MGRYAMCLYACMYICVEICMFIHISFCFMLFICVFICLLICSLSCYAFFSCFSSTSCLPIKAAHFAIWFDIDLLQRRSSDLTELRRILRKPSSPSSQRKTEPSSGTVYEPADCSRFSALFGQLIIARRAVVLFPHTHRRAPKRQVFLKKQRHCCKGYSLQIRSQSTPLRGHNQHFGEEQRDSRPPEWSNELIGKRGCETVPPPHIESCFYSHYFLIPKKDGGLRPILDFRHLNRALVKRPFKMLTLKQILLLVCPGYVLLTSSQWSNSYRFFLSPGSTSLKIAFSSSSLMKFCLTSTCPRTADKISSDDPHNHLHSSLHSGPFRSAAELSVENLYNRGHWRDFFCTCFTTLISSVILSKSYADALKQTISTIFSVPVSLLSMTRRHFEFAKNSGTWSISLNPLHSSSSLALYCAQRKKFKFQVKLHN